MAQILYTLFATFIYVFVQKRPSNSSRAFFARLNSFIAIIIFIAIILFILILNGAAFNSLLMFPEIIIRNVINISSIVILGEFIKHRIIKSKSNFYVEIIVTILSIFFQIWALYFINIMLIIDLYTFFEVTFRIIIINICTTHLTKNSLAAPIILNLFFSIFTYISPLLPHISSISLYLIMSTVCFVSIFIKYIKEVKFSIVGLIITVAVFTFVLGLFPVYPKVILTPSMSGTLEVGDIAIIERNIDEILIGDVIHFVNHTGIDAAHRVVAFYYYFGVRKYVTRGDANYTEDTFAVHPNYVKGRVIYYIPIIGYPIVRLRGN